MFTKYVSSDPQVLCYDESQDSTMGDAPPETPEDQGPSTEAKLSNARRENHALFMELQAEKAARAEADLKNEQLEATLDPNKLDIEEKARRFKEDPKSLGIPEKTLQRDASQDNVPPKPRHVTEVDLKNMTSEERLSLDPRQLKRWRAY